MRVVILTQYFRPEYGGPQARLSDLVRRFADRGHEVIVLTAMPNYPAGRIYPGNKGLYRRDVENGITILRGWVYATKALGARRFACYVSWVGSSLVIGLLRLPRADVLITESPPLLLGISGFILSRVKRARWIFNVSDLWPESAVRLGVLSDGWMLRQAEALERFCYRRAWVVTGQTREILDSITRRYPGVATYHLSNGVDVELFAPERRSPQVRAELADGARCVALYAGLHGVAQGLDQVLEAAVGTPGDFRVVLIGEGPCKEQLADRVSELGLKNVRLLSARPPAAIPELLASADLAVIPLVSELPGAVPSKLYEAMGAGLPIVLVATGEPARIVQETECGLVVRPGDIVGLRHALLRLAEDGALRLAMATNARRAAEERFSREAIGQRFIGDLETGVAKGRIGQ